MKVKKKTIIHVMMMICMFAILEPSAFIGTWIHTIDGYIRTLAFMLAIPLYFYDKQYRNTTENLLLAFVLLMGLSTIIYYGGLTDDCSYIVRITTASIVLLKYMYRKNPVRTCRDMGLMLSLFLVFDALTWVLPGLGTQVGTSIRCFLGTKTTITYYLLPALAFDYAYYRICNTKQKRTGIVLLLMAIGGTVAYLIQMPISTTIVSLALSLALLFISEKGHLTLRFVSKYGILLSTVTNILFLSGMSISFFSTIITSVLHESSDLTGRIQIWQMAFIYIVERPLLGYGLSTGIHLSVWSATNVSAHNLLLGILMKTGFIGLVLFLIILFFFQKHNNRAEKRHRILSMFMIGMLVIICIEGISEDFISYPITFCLLSLAGNIRKIQDRLSYANSIYL